MTNIIISRYNNKETTMEEIKSAATYANALKFIENNQFGMIYLSLQN